MTVKEAADARAAAEARRTYPAREIAAWGSERLLEHSGRKLSEGSRVLLGSPWEVLGMLFRCQLGVSH